MAPSHLIPHNAELSTFRFVSLLLPRFVYSIFVVGELCGWGFINLKAFSKRFRSPLRPITLFSITTNLNYDKCYSRNYEIKAEGKVFCLFFICFHFPFHENFPSLAQTLRQTKQVFFLLISFFYIKELMDIEVVYNLPRWIFHKLLWWKIFISFSENFDFSQRRITNRDLLKIYSLWCCERQVKVSDFSFWWIFRKTESFYRFSLSFPLSFILFGCKNFHAWYKIKF